MHEQGLKTKDVHIRLLQLWSEKPEKDERSANHPERTVDTTR
jgi:hypothetical protein